MKKMILAAVLGLTVAVAVIAQDVADSKPESHPEPAAKEVQEGKYIKDLTGKEKRQLEDQLAAEVVAEHNAEVENDLDEVVCKKVTVTGSRKKQRVCQTRREIQAEEAATKQMMRQRNRSSSVPPLPTNSDPR